MRNTVFSCTSFTLVRSCKKNMKLFTMGYGPINELNLQQTRKLVFSPFEFLILAVTPIDINLKGIKCNGCHFRAEVTFNYKQ